MIALAAMASREQPPQNITVTPTIAVHDSVTPTVERLERIFKERAEEIEAVRERERIERERREQEAEMKPEEITAILEGVTKGMVEAIRAIPVPPPSTVVFQEGAFKMNVDPAQVNVTVDGAQGADLAVERDKQGNLIGIKRKKKD